MNISPRSPPKVEGIERDHFAKGSFMKAVIALLLMSIAGVAVCEDIKTLDHKVYKNATITRTEPDGIVIQYSAGIVKIPFTDLPEEFSKRYDYDPEEAKTFKADIEQKQAQIYLETQAEKARQEESREAEQQIKQNEKRMAADEAASSNNRTNNCSSLSRYWNDA